MQGTRRRRIGTYGYRELPSIPHVDCRVWTSTRLSDIFLPFFYCLGWIQEVVLPSVHHVGDRDKRGAVSRVRQVCDCLYFLLTGVVQNGDVYWGDAMSPRCHPF
jgi:hypothetical protein